MGEDTNSTDTRKPISVLRITTVDSVNVEGVMGMDLQEKIIWGSIWGRLIMFRCNSWFNWMFCDSGARGMLGCGGWDWRFGIRRFLFRIFCISVNASPAWSSAGKFPYPLLCACFIAYLMTKPCPSPVHFNSFQYLSLAPNPSSLPQPYPFINLFIYLPLSFPHYPAHSSANPPSWNSPFLIRLNKPSFCKNNQLKGRLV